MTSYDAAPGCTPFEEELVNAMRNYADSADAPVFDAPGIVRRTRRRRAAGIAAVATALIVAGGGTALAAISGGTDHEARPAVSTAPARSEATTVLVDIKGDKVRIDLAGYDLTLAREALAKGKLIVGTVSKRPVTGCKPGSVLAASPHAPTVVKAGDTINLALCAG
ncbi:PASTA domain-containing protein [Streptomyces sp. NPDC005648]|uniref:PASTA domain-containing protein n=1 Tax=Streptomyces sp. NPDC005648 TaxID=3157044 RepID=UPI00339E25C6